MNTIDTKLHTLISAMTGGETVIFANQNAPQPPKPFWMIRRQSDTTLGLPEYVDPDANGIGRVIETKQMTVNVQRFADPVGSSFEKLQQFRVDLKKTLTRDAFAAQRLTVYDTGPVQDVTALLDNAKYEDRASIDLFVGYRFGDDDNVGLIETVEVTPNDDSTLSEWQVDKFTVSL